MYRDGLAYRYLGKSRLSAEAEYLSMRGAISAAGVKIGMKIWWDKLQGTSGNLWPCRDNFGSDSTTNSAILSMKLVCTDLRKFNFDFWSLWGWIFRGPMLWNWKGFGIVFDYQLEGIKEYSMDFMYFLERRTIINLRI